MGCEMKFKKTSIEGCFIIAPEPFSDRRGQFRRHFCTKEFSKNGLNPLVKQSSVTENRHIYTFRGFHYQKPPHEEDKTVSCLKGHVYDIVLDLRRDSKSYLKWQGFTLSDKNRLSIYIPRGCAHAYLTLEADSMILYHISESHHPRSEQGIRYDDPFFKIVLPHAIEHISERDRSHPFFPT